MTLKEEKQNLLAMLEEIRERDYIKASEKTTGQLNELWTDIDNDFFTVVVFIANLFCVSCFCVLNSFSFLKV